MRLVWQWRAALLVILALVIAVVVHDLTDAYHVNADIAAINALSAENSRLRTQIQDNADAAARNSAFIRGIVAEIGYACRVAERTGLVPVPIPDPCAVQLPAVP